MILMLPLSFNIVPKSTLTLRRQIRSISSTRKMTKAMELVSASKMRRAVATALATRPYAEGARDILNRIDPSHNALLHPLLAKRAIRKTCIVLISTNRGLCGGFNNALIQTLNRAVVSLGKDTVSLITLGKRGRDAAARAGYAIMADFPKEDITRSVTDIIPIASLIIEQYVSGAVDSVQLVSMHFMSSVRQEPRLVPMLPFDIDEYRDAHKAVQDQGIFEPSDEEVLSFVIPRLLEMQLFHAVLESEAAEQSARMLAMHNASQAAQDLLSDLQLTYNQQRQAAITQEIAEISSGRAALE